MNDHKGEQDSPWKLEGYSRPSYSKEESTLLHKELLFTLYTLLLIYLSLHLVIVPLVMNLALSRPWMLHLHGWFFVHVVCYWHVKKKQALDAFIYSLLVTGSMTRFFLELSVLHKIQSWIFLSLLICFLSEICFFVFIAPQVKPKKSIPGLCLGLILASFSFQGEQLVNNLYPIKKEIFSTIKNVEAEKTWGGCQPGPLSFHLDEKGKFVSKRIFRNQPVLIRDCGVEYPLYLWDAPHSIIIKNQTNKTWSFRLYKLHQSEHRMSWQFVRMYILKKDESTHLTTLANGRSLNQDKVYLVRSPEYSQLGFFVFIQRHQPLPYPKGRYDVSEKTFYFEP